MDRTEPIVVKYCTFRTMYKYIARSSCQGWAERKRLAELLANQKAMGPILGFLKATEVGGREGAREREEEWGRKNDQLGEDLLGD